MTDKYTCTCCGGKINPATLMCEYCGTIYKDNYGGFLRVETFRNPVRTLAAKCIIPRNELALVGESQCADIAQRNIRDQIAEALTDVMKYDVEFKPAMGAYMVSGQIRAVIPADRGMANIYSTFGRQE